MQRSNSLHFMYPLGGGLTFKEDCLGFLLGNCITITICQSTWAFARMHMGIHVNNGWQLILKARLLNCAFALLTLIYEILFLFAHRNLDKNSFYQDKLPTSTRCFIWNGNNGTSCVFKSLCFFLFFLIEKIFFLVFCLVFF